MIIDRLYTPGLAQVAYLVADEKSGHAAVIDKRRDVESYVQWAAEHGVEISAILETHVHADFVSGALELRAATGAPIYTSRIGNQSYPDILLDDGDQIAIGSLVLESLWTPGHTPEHMSYLLIQPERRSDPVAIFSGDLLFVGEVGRPDLLGENATMGLALQLHDSLHRGLKRLPDDSVVYPGHTAGSSCGKNIGEAPQSTMGTERQRNHALQIESSADFVASILEGMPPAPTYYPKMKAVNRDGPPSISTLAAGEDLDADRVQALIDAGGALIDARRGPAYDRAHVEGSYYAGDSAEFVNWVGWIAPYSKPVALLLENDRDYAHFRTELLRIGVDEVVGYLAGGIDSWIAEGFPVRTIDSIHPADLASHLGSMPDNVTVLDVRRTDEWEDGHISGSVNLFAGEIAQGAEVSATPMTVTCETGYRSRVSASLLEARGTRSIVNLEGGMSAWRESGLPVEVA